MRFSATIYLMTPEYYEDDLHNQRKRLIPRKVYANEYSISQAEFSAGGMQGLRPDVAFNIHTVDYRGEEYVVFGGEHYHVYRTSKSGDSTTLYLTKGGADGS